MRLIAERFELGEFIAQGGMGAVYRGLDRQTERSVAIKSVRPELVDAALIARFQQEGETLRTLNHPNIVKLVATAQDGDQHYLIMEYVSGGSLADLLTKQGSVSADQTVSIALELADALTRAHHLKIIHRDLKPANVLLADDSTPRLTDFGVARTAQGNLTGIGIIVGTLSYLAPETLNGEPADARADIWAFGVTLFEMLTGRLPFRADSPAALITAILTRPTPDLETLRPELPVRLVDLVYRMLDKDPRQRIGTMRSVALALETIREQPSSTTISSPQHKQQPNGSPVVDDPTMVMTPATARRNNLPPQPTPFIGRAAQIDTIKELLLGSDARLVTLIGPGGTGKTRLSLRVAQEALEQFPDGAFFVPLVDNIDANQFVSRVAQQLDIREDGRPLLENVKYYLHEKRLLLVLDNFEQLLAAVPVVADLLTAAPQLKVLVSSRIALNLRGEHEFPVTPLELPQAASDLSVETLVENESIQLFVERARATQPNFALTDDNSSAVVEICRRLDGLPLALELAAARVRLLSPQAILTRLGDTQKLLTDGASDLPVLQQTLRITLEWSYGLLKPNERTLYARLGVFAGGFSSEAAESVCNVEGGLDILESLTSLVNNSLLRQEITADGESRFGMLETIRAYALERLANNGELEEMRHQHAQYFGDAILKMSNGHQLFSTNALYWLNWLAREHDNIRATLTWTASAPEGTDLRTEMAVGLDHLMVAIRSGTNISSMKAVPLMPVRRNVFISYKRSAAPDNAVATQVFDALSRYHDVFIDQTMVVGTPWAERIEAELHRTDFLITFLSEQSVHSEMVRAEIETAYRLAKTQGGQPVILPVRLAHHAPFEYPLSAYLNAINWAFWENDNDTPRLVEELLQAIANGTLTGDQQAQTAIVQGLPDNQGKQSTGLVMPTASAQPLRLESPEGTMDTESAFYIARRDDAVALQEVGRQGVTITIKGPRQMGKSSLLMRLIRAAQSSEKVCVFLDFQLFDRSAMKDANLFFRQFCSWITMELELEDRLDEYWQPGLGNSQRASRYMGNYLLPKLNQPLLLAMDEVETVFDTDFRSDFFSMLRSWHNNRATKPIWKKLDLVFVTSTEPYQFIDNLNVSPFNVGLNILLEDFSEQHVAELHDRYQRPLNPADLQTLFRLLNGHPYLTRRALYMVASGQTTARELFAQADDDRGPFGDHLRHYLLRFQGHADLIQGMQDIIRTHTYHGEETIYRLQSAGLVRKEKTLTLPRCQLYADYFGERLHDRP